MSKVISKFHRDAIRASSQVGGSHLTRESRERTLARLAGHLRANGCNIQAVSQLRQRHVVSYIESRQELAKRTLQNELSHIRAIMREERAAAVEMSNKALGVDGGSRIGRGTATTATQLQEHIKKAESLNRPGIAHAILVSRELGLRSQEVICADAKQLRTWAKEISIFGRATIYKGTKGGRVRDTSAPDPDRTTAILNRAADVAARQGGFLITRANGRPVDSLKSAASIYRSYAVRHDVDRHGLRYAYTREMLRRYLAQGLSKNAACARLSVDLGHGAGRGRYVRSVYLR